MAQEEHPLSRRVAWPVSASDCPSAVLNHILLLDPGGDVNEDGVWIYAYHLLAKIHLPLFAQSVGAVEYTDCFSAKELDPHLNQCPGI